MLLAVSACDTQEVGPGHLVVAGSDPGPDESAFWVVFPPPEETYEQLQDRTSRIANVDSYQVFLDGQVLAFDDRNGGLSPSLVYPGAVAGLGYLQAGPHHFRIASLDGNPIFVADAQLTAGATTRLFLYGPPNDLRGRFITAPSATPAGQEHVTVVNLVRTGQAIEVVSCSGGGVCEPVSPALALGDVFDADVPDANPSPPARSLSDDGAGIGFRMVPSATVPNPPVLSLTRAIPFAGNREPPAALYVAAPIYLSDRGDPQLIY